MATRNQLVESAKKLLAEASVPSSRREVEWLLEYAEPCDRIDLVAHPEAPVSEEAEQRFLSCIARRLAREPLQYITGSAEFYGRRFSVDPSVFIPRPETELLVDIVLDYLRRVPSAVVADVGAGSGCIAVSIKAAVPRATVVGVEVSGSALETGLQNARLHGVDIVWMEDDFRDPELASRLTERAGAATFDVLVSNPPYVPEDERRTLQPEVLRHEPEIALFAGSEPTFPYVRLAELGQRILAKTGLIALEIHEQAAEGVRQILADHGFKDIVVHRDAATKDRVITATPAP